jgi:hypothetical protein
VIGIHEWALIILLLVVAIGYFVDRDTRRKRKRDGERAGLDPGA